MLSQALTDEGVENCSRSRRQSLIIGVLLLLSALLVLVVGSFAMVVSGGWVMLQRP